jgi:hypothetical protein
MGADIVGAESKDLIDLGDFDRGGFGGPSAPSRAKGDEIVVGAIVGHLRFVDAGEREDGIRPSAFENEAVVLGHSDCHEEAQNRHRNE